MYQYNNYAYSTGVPVSQNIAAYSTRPSALSPRISYNPFITAMLTTDDIAGSRRTEPDDAAAARNFIPMLMSPSSSSCRRFTPCGPTSPLDRPSADVVPPPPPTSSRSGSAAVWPAQLPSPPTPAPRDDLTAAGHCTSPLDRVAVRVDADDNDDDVRHYHARSHSAPAAPRHRCAAVEQQRQPGCSSPPMWFLESMTPAEKRTDAERRLLPSPATSPPPPHESATTVQYRRTFPLSNVEHNGAVAEPCTTDVVSPTSRRPNTIGLSAVGGGNRSDDPLLSRRRLRAARGRLNIYSHPAGECALGSTFAGIAIIDGVALVVGAIAVQLLLRLTAVSRRSAVTDDDEATADETSSATDTGDTLLPSLTSKSGGSGGMAMPRTVVEEVAVGLTAVTIALDLCCLLTTSVQCFFAVRLARYRNDELRVLDYLEKSSFPRTVTSVGVFLSVPIFLLALILYAVLEYTFTSAITCVVIFTIGIVCITIAAAHSIHCWNVEKSRESSSTASTVKSPSLSLPRDVSKQTVNSDDGAVTQLKLSTLV